MKQLIVAGALVLGLTLPAMVAGAIPQPIYFWGSVVAVIEAPGQPLAIPELIRPSAILLTEDGSSDVEHLQWTGWGSSVAHATGISSASNGIPNMAQGKRIKKPAQVALSNPGLFQGHEVYRCFTLTIPSYPRSDQRLCLERAGSDWALGPTTQAKTTPTQPTSSTYAHFYTPNGNIACEMFDNGTAQAAIGCIMQKPPAKAGLKASGVATICQHQGLNCTGNLGDDPNLPPPRELPYGSSKTVGRFRCGSEQTGVTCIVIRSGMGFLINSTGITPVGGAVPTVATLHLAAFLSPDRKVLCVDEQTEHDAWCGTMTPSRLVTLKSNGEVTMCNSAAPAGCLQIWHASAPVLGYAQQTELNGFRCVSEQTGITCTVSGGSNNGKGFRINSAGITRVGA